MQTLWHRHITDNLIIRQIELKFYRKDPFRIVKTFEISRISQVYAFPTILS